MSKTIYQKFSTLASEYEVFLFDMWGVLIEEGVTYGDVVGVFNELSKSKFVYLVTNSPLPSQKLWVRLKDWGVDIKPEQIFTSGEGAKHILNKQKDNVTIYELGEQFIVSKDEYKFTTDINQANVLLLTIMIDPSEDVNQFDELLKKIVELNITVICANPDIFVPSANAIKYGPGYFAIKLQKLGGNVIFTGKPYPDIYNSVFETLPSNIDKSKILMIGDSLETDILGAKNVNIKSALVLTGNCNKYHDNIEKMEDKINAIILASTEADVTPDYITIVEK